MRATFARFVVLADLGFAEQTSCHGPTSSNQSRHPRGLGRRLGKQFGRNNGVAEKGPGLSPFHTAERAGNTDTKNTPVIPSVVRLVPK
jgi:hypothetical protein